ncbi:hypothetical protein AXF42_Ash018981 [Apostasia shenzhenica]|uniref:Uncharacterized protein n=1 Tax=Apostasia shenzhenica TaxID=1088818 RepID=A0A2I0ABZ8_9ASPA|nr:hypothetical protein AXF42_Ash018981 [Apostasia shenzhenica]
MPAGERKPGVKETRHTPLQEAARRAAEMTIRSVEIAGRTLIVHESEETVDPATGRALTGSWLWDSALHLAEWMAATRPGEISGSAVLELGAGAGLPGLAAAALGSRRVVLTDTAPMLPMLRRNVEANGLADRVEVRELRWGSDDQGGFSGEIGSVDVVLMSDLFFDPDEMAGLGRTVRAVWGETTRGWAASELRTSTADCLEALAAEGFRVEELPPERRRLLRSPEDSALFAVFIVYRA